MLVPYVASLIALPVILTLVGLLLKGRFAYALAGASALPALAAAPLVMLKGSIAWEMPLGSVLGRYTLTLEPMAALFLSVSALVFLLACLHLYGASKRGGSKIEPWLLTLFILFTTLALLADDVLLLLLSWEGISLSSFLLCGFRREGGRHSWLYFAITHLGGLMIVGAVIFLAWSSGSVLVSDWAGLAAMLGPRGSSIALLLLLLGFGTKFGLLPFHVWMPGLYQNSPSHSVTMVAAVSSNVAFFLLVKFILTFMGVEGALPPLALGIMLLASLSAIYGALRALVQDSPMKVLAFSSMKNMSLSVLMLGLALLFGSHGSLGAAYLALLAAMLHVLFHSLFKALCTLGASDAQGLVGSESFLRLGGLARMHPPLAMLVLVGVLSMAAIPPFSGFVSEWMMIQSMMEGFALGSEPYRLALPLGMAALGLSGALGAAAYLRLYGFTFLGRPRSVPLESLRIPRSSLLALGVLGLACFIGGALGGPLVSLTSGALGVMVGSDPGLSLTPPFTLGTLKPLLTALSLAIVMLILAFLMRKNVRRTSRTWDCGMDLGPNMQYSAAAFSQPSAQVFEPLLGTQSRQEEDWSLPSLSYPDRFWEWIYLPLARAYEQISVKLPRPDKNSIQACLAYILATLMILMVVLR